MSFDQIHAEMQRLASPEKVLNLQRFFRTGPGEYGEGDQFPGIKVPELRALAQRDQATAVLATFHFISHCDFAEALAIAKLLPGDSEDLIHKAVGWLLRFSGKRNFEAEETFLQEHYRRMPHTMLRYAIERFPEARRRKYLDGKI